MLKPSRMAENVRHMKINQLNAYSLLLQMLTVKKDIKWTISEFITIYRCRYLNSFTIANGNLVTEWYIQFREGRFNFLQLFSVISGKSRHTLMAETKMTRKTSPCFSSSKLQHP
jgi:hypothetical protein